MMSRASLFGLCAALLYSAGQTVFIGAFGASFRSEFSLSDGLFGSFYGAATLASGLLMFWPGAIADRYRRHKQSRCRWQVPCG